MDGCGAPVLAVSLTGLARAYLRLVDAEPGSAPRTVADAMRAYPEIVGGTRADDTRLMRGVPGLLAKVGAEGVIAAALPGVGAVALKIDDGADRARMPVLVSALRRLGVGRPGADRVRRAAAASAAASRSARSARSGELRPSQPRKSSRAALTGSGRSSGSRCAGVRHVGQPYRAGDLGGDPVGEPADVRYVGGAGGDQHGHPQLAEPADRGRRRARPRRPRSSASSAASARRSISCGEREQLGVDVLRAAAAGRPPRTAPHRPRWRRSRPGRPRRPGSSQRSFASSDHSLPETAVPKSASALTRSGWASAVSIGHRPAEGAADQGGPGQVERVQQPGHVVVVRERGRRQLRVPVAAQVRAITRCRAASAGELPAPHPPVGDAGVQQDDGRTGAGLVVRDACAVDCDLVHGRTVRIGRAARNRQLRPC